jgi:GGDEF domain-containing protein
MHAEPRTISVKGRVTGDIARAAFRRTDLVARMGGDEFVVLADGAGDDDDVEQVLAKVQQ